MAQTFLSLDAHPYYHHRKEKILGKMRNIHTMIYEICVQQKSIVPDVLKSYKFTLPIKYEVRTAFPARASIPLFKCTRPGHPPPPTRRPSNNAEKRAIFQHHTDNLVLCFNTHTPFCQV